MADDVEPLILRRGLPIEERPHHGSHSSAVSDGPICREKASKSHLVLAVAACAIGSALPVGLNIAILNAPTEVIKDFYNQTYFERNGNYMPDFLLTVLWAITVASFAVGGMIGGLSAAYFAGKYGRKRALLANNSLAFICAALQGCSKSAKSFEMLIAGRIVAGIYCGLDTAVAPLYLAEISPVAVRGFCCTCSPLALTFGVLVGQVLGLGNALGTANLWPILVASPAVPAIYSLLTFTFCPESPRYLLVNKGDDLAAKNALTWLRKTTDVEDEMEVMRKERMELQNSPKFSVKDLWQSPSLRWPLVICVVLQMSMQFSGFNAVTYYSTSIFMSADLSEANAQYATVGTGAVNVIMTFVSALIVDYVGRRTLHLIGLGGMCIFSVVLVVCLIEQPQVSWLSYITVVAVLLFMMVFALGPGAIPWFIVAELFAQGPRTAAVSVSVAVNWLCNFTVGIVFPLLQKSIDKYSFLPFTVMLALFFIFTFLFVPETKGRTIGEMTMIFQAPASSSSSSDLLVHSDVQNDTMVTEDKSFGSLPIQREGVAMHGSLQRIRSQKEELEDSPRVGFH